MPSDNLLGSSAASAEVMPSVLPAYATLGAASGVSACHGRSPAIAVPVVIIKAIGSVDFARLKRACGRIATAPEAVGDLHTRSSARRMLANEHRDTAMA